jgi:uncharacterized protein YjbI with pentapeptide repeats
VSEQEPVETATQPRPMPEGHHTWDDYWTKQHYQPWRTEPEIDAERRRFLAERRAIQPNVEEGIYPFRDASGGIKLTRADVEWLLATHESGGSVGPVDWSDERQRAREGLDLRGADLGSLCLDRLPLARLRGGISAREWRASNEEQREAAAIHLESASINEAHLESALLRRAHLEKASLKGTHLEGADLHRASLRRAYLPQAHLMEADLLGAHLEAAYLAEANLAGADLREAFCDTSTDLAEAILDDARHGSISLADVRWGDMNLAVVDWSSIKMLGDERRANAHTGLAQQRTAVRANQQLATTLRAQGLGEEADRFAYRAQVLQRRVLRLRRRWLRYLGSLLLDLIAGYGYKPLRSFFAYVAIICVFAGLYLLNAQFAAPHLTWDETLVLSISSFHGRGFFNSGISLGDTLARLAAGEAIIGLLIEITFIATFTQRFFAR